MSASFIRLLSLKISDQDGFPNVNHDFCQDEIPSLFNFSLLPPCKISTEVDLFLKEILFHYHK